MSQDKDIIVEISSQQYAEQISQGLTEEEVLRAGTHVFKRGGFRARHPNFNSKDSKVRITLEIDGDVLRYFQKRAERSNAESCETEINAELRAAMTRDIA